MNRQPSRGEAGCDAVMPGRSPSPRFTSFPAAGPGTSSRRSRPELHRLKRGGRDSWIHPVGPWLQWGSLAAIVLAIARHFAG